MPSFCIFQSGGDAGGSMQADRRNRGIIRVRTLFIFTDRLLLLAEESHNVANRATDNMNDVHYIICTGNAFTGQ